MRDKFDSLLLFPLLVTLAICFGDRGGDVVYGQESKGITQIRPAEDKGKSLVKEISEQIPKLKEMSSEELGVLVDQIQKLSRKRAEAAALSNFCNEVVSQPDSTKAMSLAAQIQFIEMLNYLPVYWLNNHTEKQESFTQAYHSVEFILIASDRLSVKKEKVPKIRLVPINNSSFGWDAEELEELERHNRKAHKQWKQFTEFNSLQDDYLPAATKALAACLIFDDEKKSIMNRIMSCPSISDEFRKQILAQRAKNIVSINRSRKRHGKPVFEVN